MKHRSKVFRLFAVLFIVFFIGPLLFRTLFYEELSVEDYVEDPNQYQTDFINALTNPAIQSYRETNVLPSVVIAQAILESDWGRSQLSLDAHNYFGIKGSYNGGSITVPTEEYVVWDGVERPITIYDDFRKYPSIQESLSDHSNLMLIERYTDVTKQDNYRHAAQALQDSGYATDPLYAKKIIDIIEVYRLETIDIRAKNSTVPQ